MKSAQIRTKKNFEFGYFSCSMFIRGHTFMTSSILGGVGAGGRGSGEKWSKFRRRWIVTGGDPQKLGVHSCN